MNHKNNTTTPLCVTKEDIRKFLKDEITRPFTEVAIEHGLIKVIDDNTNHEETELKTASRKTHVGGGVIATE